jgi:hypothetical protein
MRRLFLTLAAAAALCGAGQASAESMEQHGQILIVPCSSALLLQVDTSLRPLWQSLQVTINNLTNADRRIFVETDDAFNIRRLVIVQFETVIPGADFRFVYPPKPPAVYGDFTYRFGAYVYDDERAAARFPDKEAGRTRALLLNRGFKLPRLLRTARLARVADPAGLSEVIIFYMENADADYPAGPLSGADDDGDLSLDTAAGEQMLERLKTAVHLIAG